MAPEKENMTKFFKRSKRVSTEQNMGEKLELLPAWRHSNMQTVETLKGLFRPNYLIGMSNRNLINKGHKEIIKMQKDVQ